MRRSLLLAATALVAVACDSHESLGPSMRPEILSARPLRSSGFTSSFTHTILPLLSNVQANLSQVSGAAINHFGWVAGISQGPFDGAFFESTRATLWTPMGAQNLGALHPISASQPSHAVVWTDHDAPPTIIGPSGNEAFAYGINDVGQVVGANASGAFVWSAGSGVQPLGDLGGTWTVATAVNNLGVVVDFGETSTGGLHPFCSTQAGGIEDLGLPPGATHATARGISKSGAIAVSADLVDDVTGAISSRAFHLVDGTWIDLEVPGMGNSYALAVNESLQVAGSMMTGQTAGVSAVSWDVTLTPTAPTFAFQGFFAPVQNLPVVNRARAGQAIPVKFSLGNDFGINIFAAGFPTSQSIACDNNAPSDPVESTASPGASTLSYDSATETYSYVWKTDREWAGSCRRLTVRLTDGSEHSAHFSFTK